METKQTYNGWPNRETWNVMLWLDNDESAYRYYTNAVGDHRRHRERVGAKVAKLIAVNALGPKTGDGVSLDSPKIRWGRIAEAMRESVS